MIRVKISNFIKNNINKFRDLGVKLIIVAIVVFIATIILSLNRNSEQNSYKNDKNVYKPTETVIKGSDVSEKQYEIDDNIIESFIEYCNSGKVEEAYNLLSDECKEYIYSTKDIFKENYHKTIFKEKRTYNLQSWISTNNYTIYKIRYTTNILATGTYEEDNIYQDYITLFKDTKKISIGSFITTEKLDITTNCNSLEMTVIERNIYLDNEEYKIQVKNNTNNTILLDTLENSLNIKLTDNTGISYSTYINRISKTDLIIEANKSSLITIRFKKNVSSNNKSENIKFLKVINDYDSYNKDKENYRDISSLTINL